MKKIILMARRIINHKTLDDELGPSSKVAELSKELELAKKEIAKKEQTILEQKRNLEVFKNAFFNCVEKDLNEKLEAAKKLEQQIKENSSKIAKIAKEEQKELKNSSSKIATKKEQSIEDNEDFDLDKIEIEFEEYLKKIDLYI